MGGCVAARRAVTTKSRSPRSLEALRGIVQVSVPVRRGAPGARRRGWLGLGRMFVRLGVVVVVMALHHFRRRGRLGLGHTVVRMFVRLGGVVAVVMTLDDLRGEDLRID